MLTNNFTTDHKYFINLIDSGKNFAFTRYADGEVSLMQGQSVGVNTQAYNIDKWSSPNTLTSTGVNLLNTLTHTEDNYYYAISGKNDSIDDYNFLVDKIKNPNLTFVNLWINANYIQSKKFFNSISKEIYLISNHKTQTENFPFTIKEFFPFPDDCINYFELHGLDYIKQLCSYVKEIKNQTFFISAGPISEILIHEMYLINPNNQYIDMGSSLDEYIHGYPTRAYMDPNSNYSKSKSYF